MAENKKTETSGTAAQAASRTLAQILNILPMPSVGVGPRGRRWTKIETIAVENFKAIKSAAIPVSDVTVLVGPNGSGKSSVLQAIHWAARAASYIPPKNTKEMMSFDRLDYLPSSDTLSTAHKGVLKSETRTKPTRVIFNHSPAAEDEPGRSVTVRIWAARNKGGITAHIEGGSAVSFYKRRDNFLTAYIPGLAGLSEQETILAQPLLRRQAASGDAGSVLRNVLFNLAAKAATETNADEGKKRLARLNQLVGEVHPGVLVSVNFDEREDYNISATYSDLGLNYIRRSLETAATGVLQVIQIFAYLILFRPRLMLIDEPDAHLHPDKQERLIEALERATKEFDTQIILTTHSPHIVKAASPLSKIVWMKNGAVETDDDDAIRRLLGWGGLDKDVLFFVEDEDDKAIRAILRQWPIHSHKVAVCRCFGIDNLPKNKLLEGLLVDGQVKVKAVIHRDRDFMTDEEMEKWRELYTTQGTFPWITTGPDVESYFCESDYLAKLYSVSPDVAELWRIQAANEVGGTREKFYEKRKNVVRTLWPNGGSPNADVIWKSNGEKSPTNTLGKKLHKALCAVVQKAKYDEKLLSNFTIPEGVEVAADLKSVLIEALKKL